MVPPTVQFSVQGGVVALTGQVHWDYQAQAAAAEAKAVAGVKRVENFTVKQPFAKLGDEQARQRLAVALAAVPNLDATRIGIRVANYTVVLSGAVRSWDERDKATQAAWAIPGVGRVENYIDVTP